MMRIKLIYNKAGIYYFLLGYWNIILIEIKHGRLRRAAAFVGSQLLFKLLPMSHTLSKRSNIALINF